MSSSILLSRQFVISIQLRLSSSSFLVFCVASIVAVLVAPVMSRQHSLVQRLKKVYPDFIPHTILDIGANKGEYATIVRNTYPNSYILLFEASDQHNSTLQAFVWNDTRTSSTGTTIRSEYHIGVLSSIDDEVVEFYVSAATTGNSIFRENTKHFKDVKPVEKRTKTVDSIIAESPLLLSLKENAMKQRRQQQQQQLESDASVVPGESVSIDIIKADVQGSELIVLQGAHKALQQATFVQLEGSTVEYNVGGACFYQMDALLRSYGYYLHEINDFSYNDAFKTKGLGQFDVMYVRPSSPKLPLYLKENNTTFCGAGRHPLDLPGVYDITKSRIVSEVSSLSFSGVAATATTTASTLFLSSSSFSGMSSIMDTIVSMYTTKEWYSGFIHGILVTMIVIFFTSCSSSSTCKQHPKQSRSSRLTSRLLTPRSNR